MKAVDSSEAEVKRDVGEVSGESWAVDNLLMYMKRIIQKD